MDYTKSRYQDETAESLDREFPDDEIGSVDELGSYRRYNADQVILNDDSDGFVWVIYCDTDEQLAESWTTIVTMYAEYDAGAVAPA